MHQYQFNPQNLLIPLVFNLNSVITVIHSQYFHNFNRCLYLLMFILQTIQIPLLPHGQQSKHLSLRLLFLHTSFPLLSQLYSKLSSSLVWLEVISCLILLVSPKTLCYLLSYRLLNLNPRIIRHSALSLKINKQLSPPTKQDSSWWNQFIYPF